MRAKFIFARLLRIGIVCAFWSGGLGKAAELSDQQFQAVYEFLVGSLHFLETNSAENIDTVQAGLAQACAASVYARNNDASAARDRFAAGANELRVKVGALRQEIASRKTDARQSGVMIALLAREQAVAFDLYRWHRSVAELTDLAFASSGHSDEKLGNLHAGIFRVHENTQKALSDTIRELGTKFP